MIANDTQLRTTLDRISWFQNQIAYLRNTETNPTNYHASVSGFLAELHRMQEDVNAYFQSHPTELAGAA